MAKKELKDQINAALDIADKMKDFDSKGETHNPGRDEELRRRAEERKSEVARIRADMEKKKDDTDERFIKEKLRRLAELSMETLELLKDEIQYDPTGRMAECMSALVNATVSSMKELKEYENDKTRIGIEQEKLAIKKSASAGGGTSNNILVVGKMTDVLKAIQDQKFSNMKEAEKISDREKLEDSGPGTVFEKDN